ncbi:hypothetical protein G6O69_03020 [Pseudenhygromyxa sp. WMMC2535]|uniref:hypothetical protein n=1 Tax=Pseudenhygromyxa sp. WMMC2535 TaxID=2712867 RepID=UPI001554B97B|nr:hypothetical protein [Pseudenhygromyxa sp. WMMC2535]NVB36789.1 hypothetical protein [Pseudenhygromyxa sp. WMMC2535]
MVAERYRLDQQVASGSAGVAFKATRLEDGFLVRMLRRDLDGVDDDYLLRVNQLLTLDMPGLPRAIEHFVIDLDGARSLWMVHENVRGHSLAELDAPLEKDQLLARLGEAAALLDPLHARWPPMIHGALSLSSLLCRGSDDRLTLVDFDPVTTNPSPTVDMRELGQIASTLVGKRDAQLARQLQQLLASVGDATEARTALATLRRLRSTEASPEAKTQRMSSDELAFELGVGSSEELELVDPAAESGVLAVAGEFGERLASASGSSIPVRREARKTPIVPTRKRTRAPSNDAPIMRPEELSRELSAAHRVANEMQKRRRVQVEAAKVLIIAFVALVVTLITLMVVGFV